MVSNPFLKGPPKILAIEKPHAVKLVALLNPKGLPDPEKMIDDGIALKQAGGTWNAIFKAACEFAAQNDLESPASVDAFRMSIRAAAERKKIKLPDGTPGRRSKYGSPKGRASL
jgi:hypothetical protein